FTALKRVQTHPRLCSRRGGVSKASAYRNRTLVVGNPPRRKMRGRENSSTGWPPLERDPRGIGSLSDADTCARWRYGKANCGAAVDTAIWCGHGREPSTNKRRTEVQRVDCDWFVIDRSAIVRLHS